MRTVITSPEAKADAAEALAFLGERSPEAAAKLAADLDARTALLASQPTMGRVRDDISPGLRSSVVGKHLLF